MNQQPREERAKPKIVEAWAVYESDGEISGDHGNSLMVFCDEPSQAAKDAFAKLGDEIVRVRIVPEETP